MACEDEWRQANVLARECTNAIHAMLAIRPHSDPDGQMTQADLLAQVKAQTKYARAEAAWMDALIAALEAEHHKAPNVST